jgi:hypothetical protein
MCWHVLPKGRLRLRMHVRESGLQGGDPESFGFIDARFNSKLQNFFIFSPFLLLTQRLINATVIAISALGSSSWIDGQSV